MTLTLLGIEAVNYRVVEASVQVLMHKASETPSDVLPAHWTQTLLGNNPRLLYMHQKQAYKASEHPRIIDVNKKQI